MLLFEVGLVTHGNTTCKDSLFILLLWCGLLFLEVSKCQINHLSSQASTSSEDSVPYVMIYVVI